MNEPVQVQINYLREILKQLELRIKRLEEGVFGDGK